jgi:tRNA-dihydrouridine synthase
MGVESAAEIVKALTHVTTRPVSVKFRIEPDVDRSVQFARAVEAAGASAITVHGRVKDQKHQGAVDYAKMRTIFESVACLTVGNGGVRSLVEAARMRSETGCHSVMICGAALKNPSVFSTNPVSEIAAFAEMCSIAKTHHIPFHECKWGLEQIAHATKNMARQFGTKFSVCKSWDQTDALLVESS